MLIYDALKKDHVKVKALLQELVNISPNASKRKNELVSEIADELIPHARAEEAVFYNSMRYINAAKDIAFHGFQEHLEAETLLRLLQLKDMVDLQWKETAQKLQAVVEHHIKEEESEIFSAAKQLFTNDEAEMMGVAFEQLKHEVQTEGFLKTTLDMVANMMPPRLAGSIQMRILNPNPK